MVATFLLFVWSIHKYYFISSKVQVVSIIIILILNRKIKQDLKEVQWLALVNKKSLSQSIKEMFIDTVSGGQLWNMYQNVKHA